MIDLEEVVGLVYEHRYRRGMRALLKGHEIWYGIPDKEHYEASNMGRIRSLARYIICSDGRRHPIRERILKPSPDKRAGKTGHLVVAKSSPQELVLRTFVGPRPDGMEVCHWPDRDPTNCRLDNLMWGTHKENMKQRDKHGNTARGERSGLSKLKNKDIVNIHKDHNNGMSVNKLSKKYKVSRAAIYYILRRITYKEVVIKNPARIDLSAKDPFRVSKAKGIYGTP